MSNDLWWPFRPRRAPWYERLANWLFAGGAELPTLWPPTEPHDELGVLRREIRDLRWRVADLELLCDIYGIDRSPLV